MATVVVIGAGVAGLTSAMLLARKFPTHSITIVAKHMPGDYAADYASPVAGADFMPMAAKENSRWERETWPELKKLAQHSPEAGLHFQCKQPGPPAFCLEHEYLIIDSEPVTRVYKREADLGKPGQPGRGQFDEEPWFVSILDNYRDLDPGELPLGVASGYEFRSVCINTALYLPWLVGQCRRAGVVLCRGVVKHVADAKQFSHTGHVADVVINCTGLGSYHLGGVEDSQMMPIRGQVVLIRNEVSSMYTISGTYDGPEELSYCMTRASGGGTVVGGTYQLNNWDTTPDPSTSARILGRITELVPSLGQGEGVAGLDIIRHAVGLRPHRTTGVRVERECFSCGLHVVHNYGHSGWGFQGSYGCANRVLELVDEIITAL